MSMTVKTITVWTSEVPRDDSQFGIERKEYLEEQVAQEKTDNYYPIVLEDGSFQRNWLNDSAADAWITFFNGLLQKYTLTATVTKSNI